MLILLSINIIKGFTCTSVLYPLSIRELDSLIKLKPAIISGYSKIDLNSLGVPLNGNRHREKFSIESELVIRKCGLYFLAL